jgi:hypothetical protein
METMIRLISNLDLTATLSALWLSSIYILGDLIENKVEQNNR